MQFKNPFKKKVITTKSYNDEDGASFIAHGCDYIDRYTDTSPHNIVAKNNGVLNACINKISQYISNIPIHTYYYSTTGKKLLTNHKAVSGRQVKSIHTNSHIKQKDMDIIEITQIEHPLIQLIQNPLLFLS